MNGKNSGLEIACLVLGIISIFCWFFQVGAIAGVACGIGGLVCASKAKKAGISSGMVTAGFICSLIGVIGSTIVFVACVACVGCVGCLGAAGAEAAGASEYINQIF